MTSIEKEAVASQHASNARLIAIGRICLWPYYTFLIVATVLVMLDANTPGVLPVDIKGLFTTPPPRPNDILLYSTVEWDDMTCAAALQARRFAGLRDNVFVTILRDSISDPGYEACKKFMLLMGDLNVACWMHTIYRLSNDTSSTIPYARVLLERMRKTLAHINLRGDQHEELSRNVMVLDSDVALFRNVAARAALTGHDIVFQRELPCHTEHAACINGGVWWINTRSFAARRLIAHAYYYMLELAMPDQDALQHAIVREKELNVAVFNQRTHPNGFVYNFDARLHAKQLHLVHVNWAASRWAKLQRLYDLGVVERYSRCFSSDTLAALRANRSSTERHRTGLFQPIDVTQPSTRDLTSALECDTTDVDNPADCVLERAERYAYETQNDK